jgi:membrane-associated phospholipid phosphatase
MPGGDRRCPSRRWSTVLERGALQLAEVVALGASVLLFVRICVRDASPMRVVGQRLRRVAFQNGPRLYLLCGAAALLANLALTSLDDRFTRFVAERGHADYTQGIHAVEGDMVKQVQTLRWPPLTWFLAYAYLIVLPALVLGLMIVLDHYRDHATLRVLLLSCIGNYALVVPFYVLVPVREVHLYLPDVRLLLDDVHPELIRLIRPMSGADNCFPSFHAALSVSLALVAFRSRITALSLLTSVLAAAVVFSTVYIGVHWVLDVAAGIVSGAAVYAIAARAAGRMPPQAVPCR